MSAGWLRSKWSQVDHWKITRNVLIFFFFWYCFYQPLKEHRILALWSKDKRGWFNHNSAFFHCWSFIPFKPSPFIGPLHRPWLLFFTPFTPLSLGCLPLHFMPTSITLHWSKWSGPSSVSAICLLNALHSPVCSHKLFCNIQKCAPEMSFVLLKRSGEIAARKAPHLRLYISKVASVFALNVQGQQDLLFTGEAGDRRLSRCNAYVLLSV